MGRRTGGPSPGVNADVKPLSLAELARKAGKTGGPITARASLNAQARWCRVLSKLW